MYMAISKDHVVVWNRICIRSSFLSSKVGLTFYGYDKYQDVKLTLLDNNNERMQVSCPAFAYRLLSVCTNCNGYMVHSATSSAHCQAALSFSSLLLLNLNHLQASFTPVLRDSC